MATITTKYSVGDKVWWATTRQTTKSHPCPDCLGQKKWTTTSPAGTEYTFDCPRCSARYNNDRDISLKYQSSEPEARQLTIGSYEIRTSPFSDDDKVKYMCRETGVGTGQVYNERDLFWEETEALNVATLRAQEENNTNTFIVTLYNKSLEISDYQLSPALKIAETYRQRDIEHKLTDYLNEINDAQDMDEVKQILKEAGY